MSRALCLRGALVALVCGLGACSSVGDEGGDAGIDAPPALGSAEAQACATDSDCTAAYYRQPVTSVADCYCPTCASEPVNVATEMAYATEWNQLCADYAATAHCLALPCPAPPLILCVRGTCQAASRTMPDSCPGATTACPEGGVYCGDICCPPGEWCDDTINACRCGQGAGCGATQVCASSVNQAQACGDICCSAAGLSAGDAFAAPVCGV